MRTGAWCPSARWAIQVDTILVSAHNDRLSALPRDLRNNTALRKAVGKLCRRGNAAGGDIALDLRQKPVRGLLACGGPVVAVVVVGEGLQVGLDG